MAGGRGDDTLTGNGGADTFILSGGHDLIQDFSGNDSIQVAKEVSYTDSSGAIVTEYQIDSLTDLSFNAGVLSVNFDGNDIPIATLDGVSSLDINNNVSLFDIPI